MSNDVLELLEELKSLITGEEMGDDTKGCVVSSDLLFEWIHQVELEYAEPKGDCCG